MRYILLTLLLAYPTFAFAELSFKVGMSISNEAAAKPEVDLPDPLGILRIEYETEKKTVIFCEHISSIPKAEIGSGLNHCGFIFEL